jgi:hypothetical protein
MATKTDIKEVTDETGKKALIDFWKQQIDNSIKNYKNWLKESRDNYQIYKNTSLDENNVSGYYKGMPGRANENHSYNLFYSNVETKRPLLYSKLPTLDIRRRYRDRDRISKLSSELLERVCNYFLDNYNYDIVFKKTVLDKEITGRGVARMVFDAGFIEKKITNDLGEEEVIEDEDINLKKISIEFVPYDRLLVEPVKRWEDVSWIAFMHQLSKSEMKSLIGEKAEKLSYPETVLKGIEEDVETGSQEKEEVNVLNSRITVYEIWDKESREIILFAPNEQNPILKQSKDNYNLKNFFPIPRPLGLLSNNTSIIPIPNFRQYKIQYLELQEVEDRIRCLVNQAKACGMYNDKVTSTDAKNMLNGNDGVLAPVTFAPNLDITKLFYFKDITSIVNAINTLLVQKAQIINDIREITGLSDIVRGTTQASETATAQKIKGDFAISRLQLEQQEIEFYVRDTLKLMTELIAEHYSAKELSRIGGLNVINIKEVTQNTQEKADQQDLDQEQTQQLIQQTVAGIKKELSATFSATNIELEAIDKLIKNDRLRDFNIDIETESTIKFDNDIEKSQRIELLNTLSAAIQQLVPLKQAGMLTDSAIQELLGFIIRPFKVGRNLEEALLEKQDTSARDAKQMKIQEMQMQMQLEKEVKLPHRKLDIEEKKVDGELTVKKVQIDSDEKQAELKSDTDLVVAEINADSRKQNDDKDDKDEKER